MGACACGGEGTSPFETSRGSRCFESVSRFMSAGMCRCVAVSYDAVAQAFNYDSGGQICRILSTTAFALYGCTRAAHLYAAPGSCAALVDSCNRVS